MVGSIGGFNATSFAATAALNRHNTTSTAPTTQSAITDKVGGGSAEDVFLDWMKKSPAERMEDAWLKAHGLSKEKLAAMDPKEREAVMRKMKEDIERSLKEETEAKAKVDILV